MSTRITNIRNLALASPHFPLKREPLVQIFRASHLLHLWKKKVRNFQKTHLLFDLFEHLDFHTQRNEAVSDICHSVLSGEYKPTSLIRLSVEKSKGLCRHLSVPNCRDALVLQALSDALYKNVKAAAPSTHAFFEQKEAAFSYTKKKSKDKDFEDIEYGTLASWKKFQKEILNFSKFRNYIIVTDIANFYDFIGHRNLRNILSSLCSEHNEIILDTLIFCLGHMVWRAEYMPDSEIGLPQMDSDAPRILAHSFLYEADQFLENDQEIDFARFMDDIDIGVDTIPKAKSTLRDLDIILKSRGVRLNSGKTHILTKEEATTFFWSKENRILDKAIHLIETSTNKKRKFAKMLTNRFVKLYRRHKYQYGNGEKILKRYITLYTKCSIQIPTDIYKDILKNRPGARQNIFWHLSTFGLSIPKLRFMKTLQQSGLWVDDASAYHLADYIVKSQYKNHKIKKDIIINIANYMSLSGSKPQFISAVWIFSKHLDDRSLFEFCRNNKNLWSSDADLGRAIGSLSLRLVGSNYHNSFASLIKNSHNKEAIAALNFGEKMYSGNKTFTKIFDILKSPNQSLPNKITHSKALLIKIALKNPNIENSKKSKLQTHSFLSKDAAYKSF